MFGVFIYLLTVSLFTAILYLVSVKSDDSMKGDTEVIFLCLLASFFWPLLLTLFLLLLPALLIHKYLNRESNNVQK